MAAITRRHALTTLGGILGVAVVGGLVVRSRLLDEQVYLRDYLAARHVADYKPRAADRVRLTNARLVDVVGGRAYDPGVEVVLSEGKIATMPGLPGQPRAVPCEYTLDLKGKTVIPGLINTHCHAQMINPGFPTSAFAMLKTLAYDNAYRQWQLARNMVECLARGVTTIRDAWTEDLRQSRDLQDAIARGQTPGPRVLQSVLVSPLGGSYAPKERGSMERMSWRVFGLPTLEYSDPSSGVVAFAPDANRHEIVDAVDRAIDERGARFVKIYDQRTKRFSFSDPADAFPSLPQLEALVERARARGVPTAMHHWSAESFRRGVRTGVTSLEHSPMDEPLSEADVQSFLGSGCALNPTLWTAYVGTWPVPGNPHSTHPSTARLAAYRDQTYAVMVEDYWIPQLQGLVRATYDACSHLEGNQMAIDMLGPFLKSSTQGAENVGRLFEAGAMLGSGNDGGAVLGTPAMVREELGVLSLYLNAETRDKRFDGAEALRVATLNSAKALGLEGSFGTIEPGKVADLVVLDGDPLADPSLIGSRASAVFKEGRLVVDNLGLTPGRA